MKKATRQVFAIVRLDKFLAEVSPPENTITVKEVVLTQEEAESEVHRLNAINRDKGCHYFWHTTRDRKSVV